MVVNARNYTHFDAAQQRTDIHALKKVHCQLNDESDRAQAEARCLAKDGLGTNGDVACSLIAIHDVVFETPGGLAKSISDGVPDFLVRREIAKIQRMKR